jgi:hypothetical protein
VKTIIARPPKTTSDILGSIEMIRTDLAGVLRRAACAAACALAVPAAALAHHGFGTFAMNEDIELTGTITNLRMVNPHSWVHFDVTGADGQAAEWRCELRSATTLRRSGWTPEMFPIGARITIQGSPDRTDPRACYVSTLIFADGSSLDRYGQRTPPTRSQDGSRELRLANGDPNISGDWAAEQRVMTDPRGQRGTLVPLSQVQEFEPGEAPEGQSQIPGARGTPEAEIVRNPLTAARPRTSAVALTEAGQAALEAMEILPFAERSCRNTGILADWAGEPVNRITQSGDTITLQYGRLGLTRTIHINQSSHPANLTPSFTGHSIGRWEGDELVVETTGFAPGTLVGTTPHSDRLRVVERFRLDTGRLTLSRSYTAEDPLYFAATYSGSDVLIPSEVPYDPEPCEDLTPR